MTNELTIKKVSLPAVDGFTSPMLKALTDSLGIDRSVLASDEQIKKAWQNLPDLLAEIPAEKRDEGVMRMCVAVASGLFDSAVNYAWNAAVLELRQKVRTFGVNIVPQVIDKEFDEKRLMDLQDADLLNLCLKLNLISETGFFMLDQCRDIRNNFSAAHPAVGNIDEYEFLNFLSRCGKHALSHEQNATGVDIKELMQAINAKEFSREQYQIWSERIRKTFDAQREAIFGMLHGIYCDPSKEEHSRVSSITICREFSKELSPAAASILINQHHRYQAKGEDGRFKASQKFFEEVGLLGLLSETERHALISAACKKLFGIHQAMNNFYNEAPFAERLATLSVGHAIPETVRAEFVETVATCSVGNEYGTARAADIHYMNMIKGFSPAEVGILLLLPDSKTIVGRRIQAATRCKKKFKQIISSLNAETVPTSSKSSFEKWLA